MTTDFNLYLRNFIFIRHGESEGNAKKLCQGKSDLNLTDLGRQQALTAGIKLKKYLGVSKIFSSDLKRAYETAQIIAQQLDCPTVEQHAGLQERGWGELEGKPNDAMHLLEEMESSADFTRSAKIAGLEEKTNFDIRVFTTVNQILKRTDVDTPLIVGHGRFFYALCDLMNVTRIKQIPNATPIYCSFHGANWQLNY